jgi:dipeptidyl aminopeptidase/acylaminoacyl peptidase
MCEVRSLWRRPAAAVLLAVLLAALAAVPAPAQAPAQAPAKPADVLATESYLTPPKPIADAVLAGRGENFTLTNLSPDGRKFLITKTDGLPPLSRLACPCVYLAEMAFDPVACRARDLWVRSAEGYDLFFYADRRTVPVQVPDGARVGNPVWSPDGSKLAFYAHFPDATHIYIADTETGYSRRVTPTPVLATLVTSFQWSADGTRIQTVLRPDDGTRAAPVRNGAPAQPKVRVARDGANPSRTFRYLLESPDDMKLLEYLTTGQLALIDVRDGRVTKVGVPNLIRSVSTAPGETQFRVATVKKPFSYYVPFTRFGSQEGLWDVDGKCLCTLADRDLRDTEPQPPAVVSAQPTGPKGPAVARTGGPGGRPAGQPPTAPAPRPQPPGPDPDPDPDPNPDAPRRGGAEPTDPDGRRDLTWRPDGNGMSFLQLEPARKDAKDAKETKDAKDAKEPPRKDRVMQWLPPFGKDDAKVVYETPHRIASAQYSADCKLLFLTQTIDGQRQITAVDLDDPKTTYVIYRAPAAGRGGPPKRDDGDAKKDDTDGEQPPGRGGQFGAAGGGGPSLLTRTAGGGVRVVRISSGGDVYLTGTERARGGDAPFPRPYIDRVNIKTGKKDRIFEGKGEMLETIDAVDGDDITRVFTTRQKTDVVPDSYVTELDGGKVTKLTDNVDHFAWFRDLKVQRFQVTRVDGFRFWVRVTTPPDAKGKLPALFWIYPREYADQAAYNASAGRTAAANTGRYTTPGPRSMALLTLAGYAVVEPDVPIVGPPGRMNDNYIPDLRNSLWAAIDELDKRGLIDRDRLAVGGHSYGGFSTANALAHTPFFKAGIAGDGNYNRTLTAMTFQTERRHLWDARETYLEMSPLLWANRVNGALLMYHGMEDANVGTDPIHAEHLFRALDGLGKPAALYMYPHEGHGPVAQETVLDLWARWVAWLDMHVKDAKPAKK